MATRKTRAQLDAEMEDRSAESAEGEVEAAEAEAAAEALAEKRGSEEAGARAEREASETGAAAETAAEKGGGEEEAAAAEHGAGGGEAEQGIGGEPEVAAEGGTEAAVENEPEVAVESDAEAAVESDAEAAVESEPEVAVESDAEAGPGAAAGGEVEAEGESGASGPLEPALAHRLEAVVESLLFAAAEPVAPQRLLEVVQAFHPELTGRQLRGVIEELRDGLRESGRGLRITEISGRYQLRTPSEAAPYVKKLVTVRPPRLTRATLESLAIVAYRQPVTRPEVEEIRGVDCGAVLKHLLDKRLVKILGRKDEPGRPLLYATTPEFLEFFGLKDLKSLPTLRDFVELDDEHRAQLGLGARAEEKAAVGGEEHQLLTEDLIPNPEDGYAPVGQDEVIGELAEALDEVRQRDRQLVKSGVLPTSAAEARAGFDSGEAEAHPPGGEQAEATVGSAHPAAEARAGFDSTHTAAEEKGGAGSGEGAAGSVDEDAEAEGRDGDEAADD